MYRVGVGEEGGESRETAAVAARSLRGRVVREGVKKKEGQRAHLRVRQAGGRVQPHVRHFRGYLASREQFGFSFRSERKRLYRSLVLALRPLPLPPPLIIVLCTSRAAALALFHDTTEPRLHVPDNAGGSLLFREWWKVAADASSPPVRTASPWSVSRRERKGNGGVNDDAAAAAAAAAAASSFTTSFCNDVSEESRRFSPRRYLSLSFSRPLA